MLSVDNACFLGIPLEQPVHILGQTGQEDSGRSVFSHLRNHVTKPGKSEQESLWSRSGQNSPELDTGIRAGYAYG